MEEMNDPFFLKLKEAFKLESEEHLQALSNGLLAIENGLEPSQVQKTVEVIFREAHSLKGAARSVSLFSIQEICQALENVLAVWKEKKIEISKESFNVFHSALDLIRLAIVDQADNAQVQNVTHQLNEICKKSKAQKIELSPKEQESFIPQDTAQEHTHISIPTAQTLAPVKNDEVSQPLLSSSEPAKISDSFPKINKGTPAFKSNGVQQEKGEVEKDKTIRISLSKVDRLFHEAEEVLMVKMASQQNVDDLRHLLEEVGAIEKKLGQTISKNALKSNSVIPNENSDTASAKHFNSLLMHQQELKMVRDKLKKMVKTSVQNTHFINSTVDTLLEDAKQVLMQPISTIFEALPRMVRDISLQLGKETRIEFEGENTEVDRRVLEEIKDPIIHLIRNSIDHGIELPQERIKLKKPAMGVIRITVSECAGNCMELSIADDGRGLDSSKIKEKALLQKVISQAEADSMSESQINYLAFHSGVSTSPIISELSGRGLGLGIVSEKIDKLDGKVVVESSLNKGTVFKLSLPLTLSTFRGVHIVCSGKDFIMPTHNIKRVMRIHTKDIKTIENRQTIEIEGQPIGFIPLAAILNISSKDGAQDKKTHLALILKASEKTIAFGVDEIHYEHEVLVKGLGKQCAKVRNILAATIMEEGKVVLILNPSDLINSAIKDELSSTVRENSSDTETQRKVILLAEDSLTTRLLMKNVLETAGYEVKTAVDGLEAYELLLSQPVDLLLTDVEMPRMDGFTLTGKVRSLDKYKNLPVIICTSRASKEDRERGIELGANAYIDKSSFTQQGLLSFAKKLL